MELRPRLWELLSSVLFLVALGVGLTLAAWFDPPLQGQTEAARVEQLLRSDLSENLILTAAGVLAAAALLLLSRLGRHWSSEPLRLAHFVPFFLFVHHAGEGAALWVRAGELPSALWPTVVDYYRDDVASYVGWALAYLFLGAVLISARRRKAERVAAAT